MFIPKPGTKEDAVRRWNLSDRAFFGHGACHILAQEYLARFSERGFYSIWIKPHEGYRGSHVFVTDGAIAFDYRGYLKKSRLISYYWKQYQNTYPGWDAELINVNGNLCCPEEMKSIGMFIRGPGDFLDDVTPRARAYLDKYNTAHEIYSAKK